MIGNLRELLFPRLVRKTTDAQLDQLQTKDIARIQAADWSKHTDVALDEARRLTDAELGRRQSADSKATTYLAATAALVPIALTLQAAVWDKKTGNAPVWLNAAGIGVAVLYTMLAGIWAFRTLQVSSSHRADIGDLTKAWDQEDPRPELVKKVLAAARMNWNGNNRKVSGIKMTHAYLLRAFITFAIVLMLNAIWIIGDQTWATFKPAGQPTAKTAVPPATIPTALASPGRKPQTPRAYRPPEPGHLPGSVSSCRFPQPCAYPPRAP